MKISNLATQKLVVTTLHLCIAAPFFISGLELAAGNLARSLGNATIGAICLGLAVWKTSIEEAR